MMQRFFLIGDSVTFILIQLVIFSRPLTQFCGVVYWSCMMIFENCSGIQVSDCKEPDDHMRKSLSGFKRGEYAFRGWTWSVFPDHDYKRGQWLQLPYGILEHARNWRCRGWCRKFTVLPFYVVQKFIQEEIIRLIQLAWIKNTCRRKSKQFYLQ